MDNVMSALKGVVVALLSSLVIAILFAYVFRLPIPMNAYIGPFGEISTYGVSVIDTIKSVLIAWVFYGMFGGFIVLTLCGSIAGVSIGKKYVNSNIQNKMIFWGSSLVCIIPVFILSILDYIMGPW